VPLILPSDSVLRLNHDREYVPRIDGENALGKITTFSVRAPRSMIAIVRGEGTAESDVEADLTSRLERANHARKQALLLVEQAYVRLFQVEDIDLKASELSNAERREVFQTRQELILQALGALHVTVSDKMPHDEEAAVSTFFSREGRKGVKRGEAGNAIQEAAHLPPSTREQRLRRKCSTWWQEVP
jgi:hypothetical protein